MCRYLKLSFKLQVYSSETNLYAARLMWYADMCRWLKISLKIKFMVQKLARGVLRGPEGSYEVLRGCEWFLGAIRFTTDSNKACMFDFNFQSIWGSKMAKMIQIFILSYRFFIKVTKINCIQLRITVYFTQSREIYSQWRIFAKITVSVILRNFHTV